MILDVAQSNHSSPIATSLQREDSRQLIVPSQDDLQPVKGSHLPIQDIMMLVRCYLEANTSLRATALVARITSEVLGFAEPIEASHATVQNLVLRLGLYEVTRPKEWADDWIWIFDHSITVGTTKCLLVLGIRKSRYQQLQGAISHHDVQVLALIPVEKSNGEIVCQQCQALAKQTGVPAGIISDQGSDLKKGIELYQREASEVIALPDIVHTGSRMIERILTRNEKWEKYRTACCKCANAVRQSELAHLKPRKPKTKARYMNVDQEIQWGARMLAFLGKARTTSSEIVVSREFIETPISSEASEAIVSEAPSVPI